MSREPEFVGEARHRLVDDLVANFKRVRETAQPIWVSMEAPAGWGKTRVAREFYARLGAECQSDPPYWPPTIVGAAATELNDVHARRKRVYPEVVRRPPGSLPDWIWWGVACFQRNGTPSLALTDDLAQLENHATWWEAAWRAQVSFRSRHATSLEELRQALVEEATGEGLSRAAEALLGAAVPGFGLMVRLARWSKDKATSAGMTQSVVALESTIDAGRQSVDLLDDAYELVDRLAVPGLPVILYVEDLHLADHLLVELLSRLLKSQAAVMLLTTVWPGYLDQPDSPANELLRWTDPRRVTRVRHDQPGPGAMAGGLGELTAEDMSTLVRSYFPDATDATVSGLTSKYVNPLALELVCLQPVYAEDFPDGALDLTAEEIDELPIDVEELYEAIWRQLPEAVQRGLALAALTTPGAIDAAGSPDERWHAAHVADLAAALFPDHPELGEVLQVLPNDYAWTRVVDKDLRRFHEPGQRDVATARATRYYRQSRKDVYSELAVRMVADDGDPSISVIEHRARTLLALHAAGSLTDPVTVLDATYALIVRLFPHPREHGRVIDYIETARRAATGRLGPDHPAMLRLRLVEMNVHGQAGRLDEAIAEARSLRADLSRVLGADHEHTLASRHNLAGWLAGAGQVTDAIAEYRELLEDRRRLSGPDHRATLAVRANLADCFGRSGQVSAAVAEFRSLLADQVRVFGPDEPSTLVARHNIAMWLGEGGQLEAAEMQLRSLLDDETRLLGADHRMTLATRANLAAANGRAGRATEAARDLGALQPDLERVLGRDHPDALSGRLDIASWKAASGRHDEAIEVLRALLEDELRVLGPDHPETLAARLSLGRSLGAAGAAGAIDDLRSTVQDHVRILGSGHPDTIAARYLLGRMLAGTGDDHGAVDEMRAALEALVRTFGPDHPAVLAARADLIALRAEPWDVNEAIDQTRALLLDLVRVLGEDHPLTLATRFSLVDLEGEAGRLDDAVSDLTLLLDDQSRILGRDHPATVLTRSRLVTSLVDAGDQRSASDDLALAEALFERALDLARGNVLEGGSSAERVTAVGTSLGRLAGVLEASDRRDEAEGLRREHLEIARRFVQEEGPSETRLGDLDVAAFLLGRLVAERDIDEAVGFWIESVEAATSVVRDYDASEENLGNLATSLQEIGLAVAQVRPEDGASWLRLAADVGRRTLDTFGRSPERVDELWQTLILLAVVLVGLEQNQEAESATAEAEELVRGAITEFGTSEDRVAGLCDVLASTCQSAVWRGDLSSARQACREGMELAAQRLAEAPGNLTWRAHESSFSGLLAEIENLESATR